MEDIGELLNAISETFNNTSLKGLVNKGYINNLLELLEALKTHSNEYNKTQRSIAKALIIAIKSKLKLNQSYKL